MVGATVALIPILCCLMLLLYRTLLKSSCFELCNLSLIIDHKSNHPVVVTKFSFSLLISWIFIEQIWFANSSLYALHLCQILM